MLEHGVNLLRGHSREPFEEVSNGRAALEVLEQGSHRYARRAKQPLAADLVGHAFDRWALAPIEHSGIVLAASRR
jgi:hypothetical protein